MYSTKTHIILLAGAIVLALAGLNLLAGITAVVLATSLLRSR